MFSADLGVTPSASTLYTEDVFSTFLYTGSGATLTINNGIDLAGKGGLVWIKARVNNAAGTSSNSLFDSARTTGFRLIPEETSAQTNATGAFTGYAANGFTLSGGALNTSGISFTSWTFRKAPKFFDVVTWTGNNSAAQTVAHSLGVTPSMIIVKRTGATSDWKVYHADLGATGLTYLNLSNATSFGQNDWGNTAPTATNFVVDTQVGSAESFVAYLFAHDTTSTGLIRCGSFTTDASGNASVTSLGWEPQFLMVKASSTNGDWIMLDTMRGWNMTSADALLRANLSNAETTSTEYGNPTATGFDFKGGAASATYVYMAIRRPNKPPTTGTEVLRLRVHSASSGGAVSQPNSDAAVNNVDAVLVGYRDTDAKNFVISDLLRGYSSNVSPYLVTSSTAAEASATAVVRQFTNLNGTPAYVGLATEVPARVSYAFKRAPGFFDIVCYTGTGSAMSISHNLGVVPHLAIITARNSTSFWHVGINPAGLSSWQNSYVGDLYGSGSLVFNAATFNPGTATGGTLAQSNTYLSGVNYVMYLFASLPGISKIGTYIGNGTTRTINCGFAAGARFVLIKRTDAAGDWYVWDTARGIVAATDPHLSLNSTAAEVTTDDSVDPVSSGFAVNQDAATNINVSSATYLYLAIA